MKDKAKKWHLLSPEDYDKVFDSLSVKYPKLFIKDVVFLFKKGLHQDIFNGGELEFSKTIIRKFLKLYKSLMILIRKISLKIIAKSQKQKILIAKSQSWV